MSTEAEKPGLISRVVSSVEAAIARVTREKLSQEQQVAKSKADMEREYRQILCRDDNPKGSDEVRLIEIISALGLDTATVNRDLRNVHEAKDWIGGTLQIEATGAESTREVAELASLRSRHKEELAAAESKFGAAQRKATQSQECSSKIRQFQRANPDFFGPGLLTFPSNITPLDPPEIPLQEPVIEWQDKQHGACGYIRPVKGKDGYYVRNDKGELLMPDGSYRRR